jgi:heat shock protein HslJ
MKQNFKIGAIQVITITCLLSFGFSGCTGKEPAAETSEKPADTPLYHPVNWHHAEETAWQLVSLEKGGEIIKVDRENPESGITRDWYTLNFADNDGEKRISGKGAPNTYSASCDFGDDSTIGFSRIAATRMAAFFEPDVLKEQEYFQYLERVDRWAMNDSMNLLLFTTAEGGEKVILIFGKIED